MGVLMSLGRKHGLMWRQHWRTLGITNINIFSRTHPPQPFVLNTPFIPLVGIQHTQCPSWVFILERYQLCGHKTRTQAATWYHVDSGCTVPCHNIRTQPRCTEREKRKAKKNKKAHPAAYVDKQSRWSVCVCIKIFFLLVDIQHTQCPRWFFIRDTSSVSTKLRHRQLRCARSTAVSSTLFEIAPWKVAIRLMRLIALFYFWSRLVVDEKLYRTSRLIAIFGHRAVHFKRNPIYML